MNAKIINGSAAGAAWIAVLFACIACGTVGWYKVEAGANKHEIGIWNQCDTVIATGVKTCDDIIGKRTESKIICEDHTEGDLMKRVKATRAFSIMSIVIGAAGAVFPVLALVKPLPVPAVVGVALTAVGGFFALITFAVYIETWSKWYSCGKTPCDGNTNTCTIPYSFALCVVACGLFLISTGLQAAAMVLSANDVANVKTEADAVPSS